MCGQVWCPIRICALHLTHPSAHTQQWVVNTHTHREHTPRQPFFLQRPGSSWGFGALLKGLISVVVLRVKRALFIHSPHLQSLPELRLEPVTFGLQVQLSNHSSSHCPFSSVLFFISCCSLNILQHILQLSTLLKIFVILKDCKMQL